MILLCYGTRPEWIKIKPVVKEFRRRGLSHKILFTGQHSTLVPDGQFDFKLDIKSGVNRLDSITSSILDHAPKYFGGVSHILVQGDTTTVFAIALSAYHNNIPIIHLEAGLRTYDLDNPKPEEAYRQMVSRITSIHLCPTEQERKNLIKEQVSGDIYVVGNTVLDNLVGIELNYGDFVLVTMHRRENHSLIEEWFTEISKLAQKSKLEFILPIHPNPNIQRHKHLLKGVTVIEPLPYEEMVRKMAHCRFIITDSGGIQEEASFFNKKVIVCRKTSERIVGIHSTLCDLPENLERHYNLTINNYEINKPSPYGDGRSSRKIAEILSGY
jgi:UDP-N-acetylglucosamine 2-epimerase (non-hydrolysing)